MLGASATLSSPHLAQPFPQTSPAGAFTKQVRAPRSSRCRLSVFRCPSFGPLGRIVEPARIELALPGCKPGVLPLNYDPAGREGIEPSRSSFGGSAVAMTLRPIPATKNAKRSLPPRVGTPPSVILAEALGFEPMYSSRHSPGRLVGELNPSHFIDSEAATPVASRGGLSTVGCRGVAPRSSGFQPDAITRPAHSPSSSWYPRRELHPASSD